MNQTSPHNSAYRSEIDGLRAFAVLSVVAFHAFPASFVGGFIGVDVFFVISGFLITTHLFESLNRRDFSFTDFFQRRIRRIFPALILVMASTLVFGWFVLLADEFSQLGKHVASGAVFLSNFVFASEVGYFDLDAELKPLLHLWSLAVEEQFYIIWPLLLWLAWKARFNLLLLTLIIFTVSLVTNLYFVTRAPNETFFWPFSRFWELLSGSLLAWLMVHKNALLAGGSKQGNNVYRTFYATVTDVFRRSNNSGFTSLIGLLLLVLSVFHIDKTFPFPSLWTLLPVVGSVAVIVGGANSWLITLLLTNRLAVWLGLISYPLYLWHWPILSYLHIIEDGTPHRDTRLLGVLLAVLLAWGTYIFVEKPIRFGRFSEPLKSITLTSSFLLLGAVGFLVSNIDFRQLKTIDSLHFREGLEHRIGSSSQWYQGQDNWLFLGNSYNKTVEKLKLSITPTTDEIENLHDNMSAIAVAARTSETQLALLIGPNKSSIYPEFLPPEVNVSPQRHISFFTNRLDNIPNLTLYDPTRDLLDVKRTDGLIYYRTDTHWNSKGAFITYKNLMQKLGIRVPRVNFASTDTSSGDLIEISNQPDFPLINGDTWNFRIDRSYQLERKKQERSKQVNSATSEAFGEQEVVHNSNPVSDKRVWIIGDSFTTALKPYFEATFRETWYWDHWKNGLQELPADLMEAKEKPDLIVIIRVERSF